VSGYEHLKGTTFEAFTSKIRVSVRPAALFTYPDLSVACEKPEFIEAEDDDTLLNPTLIAEILSPQTEGYDLGRRAEMYRRLSSLQELVLIAQDRAHVVVQRRRLDGGWSLFEADGLEASIELTSIGCSLSLADLYEDVLERIRSAPSASRPC
jgi:Uma2 family endonuclease